MMQKFVSFLVFVLLILLPACSKSLPGDMPDLGISSDELEFNTFIKVTAPKQLNSYRSGDSVALEIENISEYEWDFNITKDILIYYYENEEWKKVSDKMIHIGATELTLEPSGNFPSDKQVFGILPNIEPNRPTNLRIIIIGHGLTDQMEKQSKGAFLDVFLRP